jgi:F-type H+-transporting ATPase subunit b
VNINLTLIGQSITFLFFVFFCMKFVWPALIGVMETREKRIAQGLDNADKADKDLELAKQNAATQIKEAKEQAAVIVDAANRRANQIVADAKLQALVEAERIKVAAQAEIDREITQAREQLRGKVASLVLVGAEKVLGTAIDASAHNQMLDKLAAEL